MTVFDMFAGCNRIQCVYSVLQLKEFNKQKSQAKAGSPENDSSQFDQVPLNDSDVVNGSLVNGRKENSAIDEHHNYGAVKGDAVISSSEIQRSTAP